MKIFCMSDGGLYKISGEKAVPIPCDRVNDYIKTMEKMRQRDEWKTSGKGAMFMGVEQKDYSVDRRNILRAISYNGDRLIYSTFTDGMGAMYFKETDENALETYIFTNQEIDINGMDCTGDKAVISAGGGIEYHLFTVDIERGYVNQITEGYTCEMHPHASINNSDKIYYTAMGYGYNGKRTVNGPCSIDCLTLSKGEIETLIESDKFDFLKPKDDKDGNLYYIKRAYGTTNTNDHLLSDIVLFPIRIVRAIGGFLNVFSMRYSGQKLRTGGQNPAKSKEADEKQLFIEGNLINAERSDGKNEDGGIIPHGWELIRRLQSGEEQVIKKGVMDYTLFYDNDRLVIIYSNGGYVGKIENGRDEKICKISLANQITVIE